MIYNLHLYGVNMTYFILKKLFYFYIENIVYYVILKRHIYIIILIMSKKLKIFYAKYNNIYIYYLSNNLIFIFKF